MHTIALRRVAVAALAIATFDAVHPVLDHWLQRDQDAKNKALHGENPVHLDGTPASEDNADEPVITANELGRRACARHVASYTVGQLAATIATARTLGFRIPPRALAGSALINGITHYIIDRRRPLLWLAEKAGKSGYVTGCNTLREGPNGVVQRDLYGPGTASMELDQALHRGIGVVGAVAVALLTVPRDSQ